MRVPFLLFVPFETCETNSCCPAPPCGADWEAVGQTCYRLVTNASPSLTYDGAASACKTLVTKGRLAAPKTSAIFTKLNDLNTGNADFWVGLDDR